MKSILVLAMLSNISLAAMAQTNPNNFIDTRAQDMVEVIRNSATICNMQSEFGGTSLAAGGGAFVKHPIYRHLLEINKSADGNRMQKVQVSRV